MTITDAVNDLFKFFTNEGNAFEISRDFHKIVIISEEPEQHKATILCALKKLEETDIVRSETYQDKTYYILVKSLESYEQTVTIRGAVAFDVGKEINEACEIIGDDTDYCDYTGLTERDIANLVNVIKLYKGKSK